MSAASLVSENKVLAHPASVDSIPSSANQEDHLHRWDHGRRQAAQVVDNAAHVLAIELICAAEAAGVRSGQAGWHRPPQTLYNQLRNSCLR